MKRRRLLGASLVGLCCLGASTLLSSCAKAEEEYAPPDYTTWAKTTNIVLDYPIPGHENRLRIPRMNAKGFSAVPKSQGGKLVWDFPEDTVIVKEIYAEAKPKQGEKPFQLTIMAKDPTDPRSRGGWLWITKDPATGKQRYFTDYCVTCHASANESHPYGDGNPNEDFRDSVFFVPGEGPAPKATGSSY